MCVRAYLRAVPACLRHCQDMARRNIDRMGYFMVWQGKTKTGSSSPHTCMPLPMPWHIARHGGQRYKPNAWKFDTSFALGELKVKIVDH